MDLKTMADRSSCGTSNPHPVEWIVSMTTPEGVTGIEIRKCTVCLVKMLDTPAVRVNCRTLNVRSI